MEHGLLPARGVSDTVLSALAGLIGTTPEALREAGERGWVPPEGPTVSYARYAMPDAEFTVVADMEMGEPAALAGGGAPPERDRIDELFTEG